MISGDTIERVRQLTPLAKLIGDRVKLERRGNSYVGLCPFHKEKTPSFHVNDERGFYYCFGCQAKGDAITFVRETEGLDFMDAVRDLAERAGVEIEESRSARERSEQQAARKRTEEFFAVNELAARYFEQCLESHPLGSHALAELERRGLSPEDDHEGLVTQTLRAFRIGYAPHGWDALAEHLKRANVSPTTAEAVGLLASRKQGPGYYDRFRHRLMFAVVDLRGRVVAFSGRSLPPVEGDGEQEPPAKYINSPESTIYRKRETVFGLYQARQAARAQDQCVLVEGNFDVMSLHARGINNVVAPLGTAFTVEQAQLIKRFSATVVVLFDGDAAGRKATRAAREPCQEAGLRARVCRLPDGSDPDDLIQSRGVEAVRSVLHGARGMLEHLIETTLDSGFAADDAQGRAQKIAAVTQLIASEDDPTVRAMAQRHADAIAAQLGISDAVTFQALRAAVHRATNAHPETARAPTPERARSPLRPEQVVASVIAPLVEHPELLDEPDIASRLAQAQGDLAVCLSVIHQARRRGLGDVNGIVDRLPRSISNLVLERLLRDQKRGADAARTTLRENLDRLHRQASRMETLGSVDELMRAKASGDTAEEDRILAELQAAARRRHGLG